MKVSTDMSVRHEKEKKYVIQSKNHYVFGYQPKRSVFTTISPQEFLDLASPVRDPDESSLEYIEKRINTDEPLEVPFLIVNTQGEIVGHEGRHRSLVSQKKGIKQIPVSIEFEDHVAYLDKTKPSGYDYTTMEQLEQKKPNWVEFVGQTQEEKITLPAFCKREDSIHVSCHLKPERDRSEFNPRSQKQVNLRFKLNKFTKSIIEK